MISMKDIAQEAKVSHTTVSMALNDRHIDGVNISEETRLRVKEIAMRHGYRQNALARSMAKGRSRLIGCLGLNLCEDTNRALYLDQIMTAAVRTAAACDYSLKLLSRESSVDQLVEECFGYRMSGVIVRSRNPEMLEELHQQLRKYNIPLVLVDTAYGQQDVTSINSDDSDGMRQIVEHLTGLGHRSLAFVAFEDFQQFSVIRRKSFLKSCRQYGLKIGEESCHATDSADTRHPFERGEELAIKLLSAPDRPGAIICNCDEIAMLVLRAAWKLGIKVPDQLSVVGFGNLPMGALACPALTSVNRPYARMGTMAIEQIAKNPDAPQSFSLPVDLILRQSSGTCPE